MPLVVDPDANLAEQQAAAEALLVALAAPDAAPAAVAEPAARLAHLVLALHDWLAHGGSLPDAWTSAPAADLDDEAEPTIAELGDADLGDPDLGRAAVNRGFGAGPADD
jgi:hypothetical protein